MNEFQEFKGIELALLSQAADKHIPINGSMELLPLCNMNCDMCYVRLSREEMEAEGRLRTGEEWLKLANEMLQNGTLFILLTGGEPLLHPDFKSIYMGLKQMGMILTLNTNATLIDEDWALFFGENRPRRINITLYGSNNATYERLCHYPNGFDKVIKAVELLKKHCVDVRLACSATQMNVEDIPHMYELAKKLGVYLETDTYMVPATRERKKMFDEQSRLTPEMAAKVRIQTVRFEKGEEEFSKYRSRILEKIDSFKGTRKIPCKSNCLAGKCSFTINWQGKLRPCVISTEPSANVFELGFAEAWKTVREEFANICYCSDCSVCALKPLCSSCAVATKAETGNYMGRPEYLCRYAKETERLLRLTVD